MIARIEQEQIGKVTIMNWKKLLWTFIAALGLAVAGCETTDGLGDDIEDAGDAVEDALD